MPLASLCYAFVFSRPNSLKARLHFMAKKIELERIFKMTQVSSLFSFAVILAISSTAFTGPIHEGKRQKYELNEEEDNVMSRIASINKESKEQLFETDINLLNDDNQNGRTRLSSQVTKRNAERCRKGLWQDKKVPYVITPELVSRWYKATILQAMNELHEKTCIRFIPRTTEPKWIEFVRDKGCWSHVGKTAESGAQRLSLGEACKDAGIIMHELLHVLGFWHEQSRPDRNQYVEILWENIKEGDHAQFAKYDYFKIDNQRKPYDFQSIMHYGNTYFSKNKQQTIRSIRQPNLKLGQRFGFSKLDIDEVNELYDCNGTSSGWSSWSSYSPCNLQCNKRRERFCTSSNPSQDCPGESSSGVQQETQVCGAPECNVPVDGHWGRWSSWGTCSNPSGPGSRSRTRHCHDPEPKNGGKACSGDDKAKKPCDNSNDCEFELDHSALCGWKQDLNDDLDWKRARGPTPSSRTGPYGDHTHGKGHYLYIEASSPAQEGHKARLLSNTIPGSKQTMCLIFSFNMYGSGMGALNVYLKNSTGKNLLTSKVGDHGEAWEGIYANIQSFSDYQIIIEAVRGDSFESDIAIDDIIFSSKSCGNSNINGYPVAVDGHWGGWSSWGTCGSPCGPGTRSRTRNCDAPVPGYGGKDCTGDDTEERLCISKRCPPGPNDCEFEKNDDKLCAWRQDRSDDLDWRRNRGLTPSSRTGPVGDHTSRKGHYLYLEASSPAVKGNKARLLSNTIPGSKQTTCLIFSFNMYGSGMGALNVYLKNSTGKNLLTSKVGDHGQAWDTIYIDIESSSDYQIIIEAVRGYSYRSDIAIDDIVFRSLSCSIVTGKDI